MLITIISEVNNTIYNCQSKPNWIQWPFYPDLGSTKPFARCFRSTLEVKKIMKNNPGAHKCRNIFQKHQ